MNAEQQRIHDHLSKAKLPPGWTCEKAWPWQNGTHLIAPKRSGGVVVKDRHVTVQLPNNSGGPCAPRVEIGRFHGRDWLRRMVDAAKTAVATYAPEFEKWDRKRRTS